MTVEALADRVIWHEVECASYAADLGLWDELASAAAPGAVLELGCGTGRVAGHLAERGHEVVGVDVDDDLVAALTDRAAADELPIEAVRADVRDLELGRRFALVIAPMQLAHLLPTAADRRRMLLSIRRHLEPGGLAALTLLDAEALEETPQEEARELIPDVRERDGWVFSSQPLSVRRVGGGIELRRLRQVVSPDGELSEAVDVTRLAGLSPDQLEAEAIVSGLLPAGRRRLPPTEAHADSLVVLLRAERDPDDGGAGR
jgi:SAM-dependent methyltransferase